MKRIGLTFFVLSFSLMTWGCSKSEYPKEEQREEGMIHLKEESQKMIGLEISAVKKQPLVSYIEVSGEIAQETENAIHVTTPNTGTLQIMNVSLGQWVEKDASLCVIRTREGKEIEVKSPHHGIVLAQYLKEGDSVDPISSILTIADTDVLRASFNVYEKDLGKVQMGQKVIIKTVAYPDKDFVGEIVFISPQVDSNTRTIKIRVNISNENNLLKFGMFVTGKIVSPLAGEGLVIPEEAIQEMDGQTTVFIPLEKKDEFLRKPVKIGQKTEGQVEVLEGLKEDERVVGKGSFYLKSELLKGELEEEEND